MSKIEKYKIPCPQCKAVSEQNIFHSINTSFPDAAHRILDDEINFVKCSNCGNRFQVKTGLLYCNHERQIAVYYHPNNFDGIDEEIKEMKRMLGEQSHLANPFKFTDWEKFKLKIRELEGIYPPIQLKFRSTPEYYSDDRYWSCDICGGDSESGCMYFDVTECPKHR